MRQQTHYQPKMTSFSAKQTNNALMKQDARDLGSIAKRFRENKRGVAPINDAVLAQTIGGATFVPDANSEKIVDLFSQRQKHAQAMHEAHLQNLGELRSAANQRDNVVWEERLAARTEKRHRQERKELARKEYAVRHAKKAEPSLAEQAIDLNKKVYLYAKWHKCSHGRSMSFLRDSPNFEVYCRCTESKFYQNPPDAKCQLCGNQVTQTALTPCGCSAIYCTRCKRFVYNYDTEQYFDKHSGSKTIILEKDGCYVNPLITVDFAQELAKQKFNYTPKESLEDALTTQYKSYAAMASRRRKLPTKTTIPEGAVASSISSTTSAGFEAIKTKIISFRDNAVKQMKDAKEKVVTYGMKFTFVRKLADFFDAAIYYTRVICDYLWALNPIMLLRIWHARDSKIILLASLIEALGIWKTAEENALMKFQIFVAEEPKYRELIIERKAPYFGCLDSLILHHAQDQLSSPMRFKQTVKNSTLLGEQFVSYDEDSFELPTVETKEQAMAGICDLICGLFKTAPKKFAEGAKLLSSLFKEYMPLLMGIKVIGDLSKMTSKVVEKLISLVTGSIKDNREWLNHMITAKGNPISDLVRDYVAYSVRSSKPEFFDDGESTTTIRAKLYTSLADCDAFVREEGRMGAYWFDFRSKINNALSVPPKPENREFEPTCLVMSGAAGAGKSTLWMAIVAQDVLTSEEMQDKTKVLDKITKKTYTWNSSSEFQPGMADKKVILFDDFQQDKETVDEALSLIHLCTNAPYPINSPNITGPEIKGMMAQPDIVVVNTNLPVSIAGQNLASPEALQRRYDLELEMLKRYNPQDPDAHIVRVARSNRYKKLEKVTLSLADARNLFHMTHMAKRAQFKRTKEMVSDVITSDIVPEMFEMVKEPNVEIPKNMWQLDEDYKRDFELYVMQPYEERKKREELEQELTTKNTKTEGGAILDFIESCVNTILYSTAVGAPIAIALISMKTINDLSGDLYNMIFEKKKNYRSYLKDILERLFKCAFISVAGAATMYGVYNYLTPKFESGTSRTAKHQTKVSVPESGSGLGEPLSIRIQQAVGTVTIQELGTTTNCLFIGGTAILIPRHLLLDDDGKMIQYGNMIIRKSTWRGSTKMTSFDPRLVRYMKGNVDQFADQPGYREDVCLYILPKEEFTSEKKLIHHFWDGKHSLRNHIVTQHDWIYTMDTHGGFRMSSGTVIHDYMRTIRKEDTVQVYHIFAEANYIGRPMSCGSPITLDRQERPIVGIHVAHSMTGGSCFHYVTRKALEDALATDILISVEEAYVPTMQSESQSARLLRKCLPPHSVIRPVGELLQHPVHSPIKTSLSPSSVHNVLPPVLTFPSVLSHTDKRIRPEFKTPEAFWTKLFAGYMGTEGTFDVNDLEEAYESMAHEIRAQMKKTKVPLRTLTIEETINGITYVDGNTSMDKTTSMGWPYVQRGMKKEDHIIDTHLEEDHQPIFKPSSLIYDAYDRAEDLIKKGIIPFLPFALTLKDERLKKDKIEFPRTRIFACANIVHYMICRKYFYAYLMMNSQLSIRDNFCAPTLDRISLDWHDLSVHMLEVGNEGFDFDFSNWDRTLQHAVIYYAVKLMLIPVEDSMTELEKATLIEMLASPFMIFGSTVLRSNGVLMSGALITFMLNCLSNELMHRVAYRSIMTDLRPDLASISYYKEYTRGIRGGDDTITVVNPFILDYYNGLTVSQFFLDHGMLVTASSKKEEIVKSKPFMDLLFLKNKTKRERGMYLPLPDFDSLIESTRYVRLGVEKDVVKATRANIECALRGLYFHGKTTFDLVRNAFLDICPDLVPLTSYNELNSIWRKYYRFPGAHADFATEALQENIIQTRPKPHPLAQEARENHELYNMQPQLITKDTQPESGSVTAMDKAQVEADIIGTTQAVDPTPPQPSKVVDNNDEKNNEKREVARVGATVQDSADVKMMPVKTGALVTHSHNDRAQQYLNDVDWDLQKLAHKFTFIEDFTWPNTAAPGTILKSYVIPREILKTPAQKAPFDVTRFWKCSNVLMKLVVKASPFYAGSLGIGFTPLYDEPNVKKMVNMGALVEKVSQDEGLEFSIPFRYFKGYIDVAIEQLGTFSVFVISPLATGPTNPTSINVAVYAAIENNEFKLPDVIPATRYYSRKLDKPATIVTFPESGKQARSVLCDINDDLRNMATTMLCAGEGLVGRPKVPHFQDAPDDIIQLLKRWTFAGRIEVNAAANTTTKINLNSQNLTEIACMSLDQMYGLYRGSVNVRIVMISETNQKAYVTLNPFSTMNEVVFPSNQGFQYFDAQTPAQITIPWLRPTFTALTPYYANLGGSPDLTRLVINLDTYDKTGPVFFEIHVCVGDDFHMGVYMGAPAFCFVPNVALNYTKSVTALAVAPEPTLISKFTKPESGKTKSVKPKSEKCCMIDWNFNETFSVSCFPTLFPVSKLTKPESGIVSFIDRALETTLPIAENISALMSLLDAHMITEQPAPLQWRKIPYSVATDNVQYTERMLTTNHNGMSLPDKDCFGTTTAETSIHNLITGTKTWLTNVAWNATDVSGTELYRVYTGPEPSNGLPGYMSQVIPNNFGYWTGSTKYIFDIIGTEMHRGQVLLVFNTIPEGVAYTDATQTYFCTYDLSQGRGTIAVSLPYLSPVPYTRTEQGTTVVPANHTGLLQVFVQNPLRATSTVAASVDIVVYKTYGDDFQLGVYGATDSTGLV